MRLDTLICTKLCQKRSTGNIGISGKTKQLEISLEMDVRLLKILSIFWYLNLILKNSTYTGFDKMIPATRVNINTIIFLNSKLWLMMCDISKIASTSQLSTGRHFSLLEDTDLRKVWCKKRLLPYPAILL